MAVHRTGEALLVSVLLLGCVLDTEEQENAGMKLPPSLRECYRDFDLYSHEKRLPMTMTTLVELIRKVELYEGSYFNMQGLAVALLHRFRMDGIESIPGIAASPGVVPYRPTGGQFYKHRIILKNLVPGNAFLFPNESLTPQELCTLHFMLSSGVEPWERGDESEVCPYNLHDPHSDFGRNSWHYKRVLIRDPEYPLTSIQGAQISRCPIEEGVVLTSKWGTVSPGVVLAAIAAALEPQEVPITLILSEPDPEEDNNTDKIEKFEQYKSLSVPAVLDSKWATTLAGDLAEVAVHQGPRVQGQIYLGPPGEWNDTSVPSIYYMDQKNYGLWQMTDAEARGGIDGLILASEVTTWEKQMNSLRLSQVLDMYYSDRGMSFNPDFRACERHANMMAVTSNLNNLEMQTMNFARVLSYNSLDAVQISDEKLAEFSQRAVTAFHSHLSNLLSGLYCETSEPPPRVHLIVVLDGTWTEHEARRILAQIAEKSDVCYYGSSMAIMNGEDGSWILEKTHSASELFRFQNNTDNSSMVTWPQGLNLKLAFGRLYSHLANTTAEERRGNVIGDLSYVILVLGYSATISDEHHAASKDMISNFKSRNPDVRFVYLGSELNVYRFKDLSTIDPQFPDPVITVKDSSLETVVPEILGRISSVPVRLMGSYCDVTRAEFEDYITPGHPVKYRIHPLFLKDIEKFSLHFQGSGYGDLSICMMREEEGVGTDCRTLKDMSELSIDISSPCLNYYSRCPPVILTITAVSSSIRCSEDDCRFPDQIRFRLRHEGLRCVKNPVTEGSSSAPTLSGLIYILVIQTVSVVIASEVRSKV